MNLVKTLMTTHPHLIDPESTLREAAKKMQEFDCGSLVVGRDEKPEGMLTDRDIVIWGLAQDHNPDQTRVSDIMTTDVITCYEDQTVEQAADIMSEGDVRRLVTLSRDNKVVGVLSIADIIKCSDSEAVNDTVIHHLFKYA